MPDARFIFPKWQFASFLLMAFLLVLMAVEESPVFRAFLILPILALYVVGLVLFARDYDRLGMEQWKRKEERLRGELDLGRGVERFREKGNGQSGSSAAKGHSSR